MNTTTEKKDIPIGTEASKCPNCEIGMLFFVDCLNNKAMVLECSNCRKRYFHNCNCELYELTEEALAEIQK